MKFLTITRHKDLLYALPPQKRAKILKGAMNFLDRHIKEGKCMSVYYHSDLMGTVSVWELESSEEGARLNIENPMTPFQDAEVIPLIEYDVVKKIRTEVFKGAIKSKCS